MVPSLMLSHIPGIYGITGNSSPKSGISPSRQQGCWVLLGKMLLVNFIH